MIVYITFPSGNKYIAEKKRLKIRFIKCLHVAAPEYVISRLGQEFEKCTTATRKAHIKPVPKIMQLLYDVKEKS